MSLSSLARAALAAALLAGAGAGAAAESDQPDAPARTCYVYWERVDSGVPGAPHLPVPTARCYPPR